MRSSPIVSSDFFPLVKYSHLYVFSDPDKYSNISSLSNAKTSLSTNIVVGIKTHISDELKLEGLARDIIRSIQNLRKDSGLEIEDRIEIGLEGFDQLSDILKVHKNYIMSEVLGKKIDLSVEGYSFIELVKINGLSLRIGISKIN